MGTFKCTPMYYRRDSPFDHTLSTTPADSIAMAYRGLAVGPVVEIVVYIAVGIGVDVSMKSDVDISVGLTTGIGAWLSMDIGVKLVPWGLPWGSVHGTSQCTIVSSHGKNHGTCRVSAMADGNS